MKTDWAPAPNCADSVCIIWGSKRTNNFLKEITKRLPYPLVILQQPVAKLGEVWRLPSATPSNIVHCCLLQHIVITGIFPDIDKSDFGK